MRTSERQCEILLTYCNYVCRREGKKRRRRKEKGGVKRARRSWKG